MSRPLFALGFVALLGFDTLGQIAFKLVATHTAPVELTFSFILRMISEPWVIAIGFAYGGAFVTYMGLMRHAAIGSLFAASHLEIVTVALASRVLFHETLTPLQLLGCAAILGGVGMLVGDTEHG